MAQESRKVRCHLLKLGPCRKSCKKIKSHRENQELCFEYIAFEIYVEQKKAFDYSHKLLMYLNLPVLIFILLTWLDFGPDP